MNTGKTPEGRYTDTQKNMDMYDFYLTPKEQRLITYLNKNTSTIKNAREDHDRLENLSIKTIYKRWSDRIYKIINEIIEEFNNLVNTKPSDSLDTKQNEFEKFPEAYPKNNLTDCDNEYHMFVPTDMTVYLMKGLKEAAEKIEQLEQDNLALRARVTNLEGN